MLKELFQASYFRMTVVPDSQTVELCGAMKVTCHCHVIYMYLLSMLLLCPPIFCHLLSSSFAFSLFLILYS